MKKSAIMEFKKKMTVISAAIATLFLAVLAAAVFLLLQPKKDAASGGNVPRNDTTPSAADVSGVPVPPQQTEGEAKGTEEDSFVFIRGGTYTMGSPVENVT